MTPGTSERRGSESTPGGRRAAAGWPIHGPVEFARLGALSLDLWAARWSGATSIVARQQRRLEALVEFARRRSIFYGNLYVSVPASNWRIGELPVTTKQQLMDHFDEVVADRCVTWVAVKEFADDPSRIGEPFLRKYIVWRTSGTSGTPGVILHDRNALEVYDGLLLARGWPSFMTMTDWAAPLGGRLTVVLIAAVGAHYAGISSWRRLEQVYPWFSPDAHVLSATTPMSHLVEALNRLRPAALVTYPSVLALLARERKADRLIARPSLLVSCGERLGAVDRRRVEAAFECRVQDVYACSESDYIAFGCRHGRLHVNADWMIVEAVDARYKPVDPGTSSHTTLLTNLANRIQPIIRYDIGDSVTIDEDRCPCGSALPTIRVDGRADDILRFEPSIGQAVRISPMAIADVLERQPQLHRFQILQTGPMSLAVRLETEAGSDGVAVWDDARKALADFLAAQGVAGVAIAQSSDPPAADPRSGKFRHVVRVARPAGPGY